VSNRGASWPRCPLPRFRFWLRGGVLDHQSADRPIAFRESDIEHAIVTLQQGFALGTIGIKEPHTILAGVRLKPECLRARAGDPVTVKVIPTHLRCRSGQRDGKVLIKQNPLLVWKVKGFETHDRTASRRIVGRKRICCPATLKRERVSRRRPSSVVL